MNRFKRAMGACALALCVYATDGWAQACIGSPSPDGSISIEAQHTTTDNAKGWGGNANVDISGPLSVQGGYSRLDPDTTDADTDVFTGQVAFEFKASKWSLCPVAGAQFSSSDLESGSAEIDHTQLLIPAGIGIGMNVEAGSLAITLFAIPQYLYVRNETELTVGSAQTSTSSTSNEFGSTVGVRVGTPRLYAGGSVFLSTIENTEPTVYVVIGVSFGGKQ
jgi:hypothetical protein